MLLGMSNDQMTIFGSQFFLATMCVLGINLRSVIFRQALFHIESSYWISDSHTLRIL